MSESALGNSKKIIDLHDKFSGMINSDKRVPEIAHRLLDEVFTIPVISISSLSAKWGVAYTSVKNGVKGLERLGVLKEVTGKRRNKLYSSRALIDILSL